MATADCPCGAKIDFFGNNRYCGSCLKMRLPHVRQRCVNCELFEKTGDPCEMIEMLQCAGEQAPLGQGQNKTRKGEAMIRGLGFWTRSAIDGRLYFYETAIDTWWYMVNGRAVRIKPRLLPKDVAELETAC